MRKHVWCLIYFPLLFVLWQFYQSNLANWDMLGHLLAARNFRDTLFPEFVGWNSRHFAGYPQGYFYPSFFHWIVGGLAKVFPLEMTFKFGVISSTLLLPYTTFLILKTLYPKDLLKVNYGTLLLMILYFVPKSPMGGDLYSAFKIGLVNENWAMVFFNLFLAFLWKNKPSRLITFYCGLLLGLTILSHAIVGFCGLLVLFFDFLFSFLGEKEREGSKQILVRYTTVGATAFFTASAWIVPYLKFSDYGTALGLKFFAVSNFIADATFSEVSIFISLLLVILLLFIQGRHKINQLKPPLIGLGILVFCLMIEGLYEFSKFDMQHLFPVHIYRFQYVILFLFVVGLIDRLKNKLEFRAILVAGCILIPWSAYKCLDSQSTYYNLGFRFPKDTRVLVYQGTSSLLTLSAPHQLSDAMQLEGIETLNGLFAESSKTTKYYLALENELFFRPMIWGIEPMTYSPRLALKHLNALGISGIVSREALSDAIKNQIRFKSYSENLKTEAIHGNQMSIEPFSAYLLDSPLFEFIEQPRFIQSPEWKDALYDWWLSNHPKNEVLVHIPEGASPPPMSEELHSGQLSGSEISNNQFSVQIRSEIPVWVQIKESYFPNWHAVNESGEELNIYESSPAMMAIKAKGIVQFFYKLSPIEAAAQYCSLLIIALSVIFILIRKMRNRIFLSLLLLVGTQTFAATTDKLNADLLVAGPYHACKVLDQKVWCWGVNHNGQLGTNNKVSVNTARPIEIQLSPMLGGSAGTSHTCFFNEQEVYCAGRLGLFKSDTQKKFYSSPHPIDHTTSTGFGMCITFKDHRSPQCFGRNEMADLAQFRFPEVVDDVQLGLSHLCIKSNGKLLCAGRNDRGQLGDGSFQDRMEFKSVLLPKSVSSILDFRLGAEHSCVLVQGKKVELYCFGDNRFSQVSSQPNLERNNFPTQVELKNNLSLLQLALGDSHTCVRTDLNITCFGDNSKHQITPSAQVMSQALIRTPSEIPFIKTVDSLFSKGLSVCIMKGKHYSCWGLVSNGIKASP